MLPCALLVNENKTPAANLHRKTRLLAKCRSRAVESTHSALETATRTKGELSWRRRLGILNAVVMMSEIRGCQKDNCAPEQPKEGWWQKNELIPHGRPREQKEVVLT